MAISRELFFETFKINISYRQYTSRVGPEERYNIKDLITAKNSTAPFLTELDIMEVGNFFNPLLQSYKILYLTTYKTLLSL